MKVSCKECRTSAIKYVIGMSFDGRKPDYLIVVMLLGFKSSLFAG